MNIYESIKETVTLPQAAERYGLAVGHGGMTKCPFHDDHRPSLKLNERYYFCFGCSSTGDVIDFTARLYGLKPGEAAQKLASDFGISEQKPPGPRPLPNIRSLRQDIDRCCKTVNEYARVLNMWKQQYAPKSPEENPHPRYTEACKMLDRMQYLADQLICFGPTKQKMTVEALISTGALERIENRLRQIKEDEAHELPISG